MATDAKKHTTLAPGENPKRSAIAAAVLSINDIIPVLSTLMWDVKPQVKEEATAAMQTCAATCKNKDIKDTIPEIIQCILEPEKVAETVHKLAGVVFVQDIEGSALAIMCPLLKRGMDEPTTSIKRNVRRGPAQMARMPVHARRAACACWCTACAHFLPSALPLRSLGSLPSLARLLALARPLL